MEVYAVSPADLTEHLAREAPHLQSKRCGRNAELDDPVAEIAGIGSDMILVGNRRRRRNVNQRPGHQRRQRFEVDADGLGQARPEDCLDLAGRNDLGAGIRRKVLTPRQLEIDPPRMIEQCHDLILVASDQRDDEARRLSPQQPLETRHDRLVEAPPAVQVQKIRLELVAAQLQADEDALGSRRPLLLDIPSMALDEGVQVAVTECEDLGGSRGAARECCGLDHHAFPCPWLGLADRAAPTSPGAGARPCNRWRDSHFQPAASRDMPPRAHSPSRRDEPCPRLSIVTEPWRSAGRVCVFSPVLSDVAGTIEAVHSSRMW